MFRQSLVAAAVLVAAPVLFASDGASARAGGGSGHGIGVGSSRAAFSRIGHARSPVFGQRRFGFAHRFRGLRLTVGPYGDWLYDAYDDPFGYGVPYGPAGMQVPPDSAAVGALPALIRRPVCHLDSETRAVPAEGGGRRYVTITRCVVTTAATQTQSDNLAIPANRETTGDNGDITTGSVAIERRGDPADAPGCRIDTRMVPATGGGERKVTVTHC